MLKIWAIYYFRSNWEELCWFNKLKACDLGLAVFLKPSIVQTQHSDGWAFSWANGFGKCEPKPYQSQLESCVENNDGQGEL